MPFDHARPTIEDLTQHMAKRLAREYRRAEFLCQAYDPKHHERRQRSLRHCHLPREEAQLLPRRDNGAYVPQTSARIEDDPNLTDGARRCARKLAEYIHRRNRAGRTAEITVTFLMKALRRSRRAVQRYLRQLERAGYIEVTVLHHCTRMCAGLVVELLAPLLPRHGWQGAGKSIKPDAPRMSQNNRFRYKFSRQAWALRCMDGVFRSLMSTITPPPVLLSQF